MLLVKLFRLGELSFILFNAYFFVLGEGVNRYLSSSGEDGDNDCRIAKEPCETLKHAVGVSADNDTVAILESVKTDNTDIYQNATVLLDKSLHFVGVTKRPTIVCLATPFCFQVESKTNKINVSFANIHFTGSPDAKKCKPYSNGVFSIKPAELTVENCTFDAKCTAMYVVGAAAGVTSLHVSHCSFTNVNYVIFSKNASLLTLNVTFTEFLAVKDSEVPFYAISMVIKNAAFVHISNCKFYKLNEAVAISLHEKWLKMKISNCDFVENSGQSIILSLSSHVETQNTVVHLENLSLKSNNGGYASSVHLIQSLEAKAVGRDSSAVVHILNSEFTDNYSEAFFGAIYADGVRLAINDTRFYNNTAGSSASSLQAFGGALFVESQTEVTVSNSTFVNNTCSGFGGAVFSRGSFSAIDCVFTGSGAASMKPLLGDIIYATAGLHLKNTIWYPRKSYSSKSAIWHPGSPTLESWLIKIDGFFIARCPVGHNITGHGIVRHSQMRSDRISMGCKSCPRDSYSLQSGDLHIRSNDGHVSKFSMNNASCYHCRYGGVCEHGRIVAKSNYYGYEYGQPAEIKFISCPSGYCCQGDFCRAYNSCTSTRTGRLCGRCASGSTENLLSARCVETAQCHDMWFWFLYFPFGLLYVWFFMYLREIGGFFKGIFTSSLGKIDRRTDEDENGVTGKKSHEATISPSSMVFDSSNDHDDIQEDTVKIGDEAEDCIYKQQTEPRHEKKEIPEQPSVTEHKAGEISRQESTSLEHGNNEKWVDIGREDGEESYGNGKVADRRKRRGKGEEDFMLKEEDNGTFKNGQKMDDKLVARSDSFSDILNITFYFYQVIFIIRDHDNTILTHTFAMIKEFSISLFTFSIDAESSLSLCPIQGLTPVTKSLLTRSLAVYVLVLLLGMHLMNSCINFALGSFYQQKAISDWQTMGEFRARLRVATIQIILLGYSTVTNMAMNLVNCVPVNNEVVLYMDGSITCFKWWQVAALSFILCWLIPFPIALAITLYQLHHNLISYNGFTLALGFPLFYVCFKLMQRIFSYVTPSHSQPNKEESFTNTNNKNQNLLASEHDGKDVKTTKHDEGNFETTKHDGKNVETSKHDGKDEDKTTREEILRKLDAPFKSSNKANESVSDILKGNYPGFWPSVMIGRRLIIILLFTFVNSPVTRLYAIFLACLLFLMHHLLCLPYKNSAINVFETVSSATLVVFCSINLFFAYSYVSNVAPVDADGRINLVFNWIEVVMLSLLPASLVVILLLVLLSKMLILLFQAGRKLICIVFSIKPIR